MIDWILAEKLASLVAGKGHSPPPHADLAALAVESEKRVTAYTGLRPARPLPPPEGIERGEWISSNIKAMRALLDPVLERSSDTLGPLRPAVQLTVGLMVTTEVAVVLGYLAQHVLGQYELVLLDESVDTSPPRLLFVLPNLGQAVENFGAREDEFMTWVTLHEVTHAVQFAGVPWLHNHVASLVRELLCARPSCGSSTPRKLRIPTLERGHAARRQRRAQRRSAHDLHQQRRTRDVRSRPGGDGGDRGTRRARDGRGGAGSAAVAAEAAPSARSSAPLAVRALAPVGEAAGDSSSSCASTSRASTSATRSCAAAAPRR